MSNTVAIVTLQPADIVDFITDDGTELTKRPYPFHVWPDGVIHRQEFWGPKYWKVVGFTDRLDSPGIDLRWKDVKDPYTVIGKYLITEGKDGSMVQHQSAIASVEVHKAIQPQEETDWGPRHSIDSQHRFDAWAEVFFEGFEP